MVRNYEALDRKKDVKSYLALKNIRLRHPLFSRLSLKAFQYLMDNSLMYKLKSGQFIYREGVAAAAHIYIIMYGQFQCHSTTCESFGALMCVGHTLGEEVIFDKKAIGKGAKPRSESVLAKVPSCVLQISMRTFLQLRRLPDRTQPDGTAQKDFAILKYILENHFEQKN